MKIQLDYRGRKYSCDLSHPLDISIPLGDVRCFGATEFQVSPFKDGNFVGSVEAGAPVNFFDVKLNPHGNGTHTECLGHITENQESINDQLKEFHFMATLVSVPLSAAANGDLVITKELLVDAVINGISEALIIRTLPNSSAKLTTDYSNTNPPYIASDAMEWLVSKNVKHLLLDLPSVDRENDNGALVAHHVFWGVKDQTAFDKSRKDCTITELIFVPDTIKDGLYFLNIQIPNLRLDAAPSKPILYDLKG